MQDEPKASRPSRRQVLRASMWAPPVVLAVEPAPAFASSTAVTITATKTLLGELVLSFTNGAAGYTVSLSSITWTGALGASGTVTVNPATTYDSLTGVFTGAIGSANLLSARTYTITYVYNGQSQVVVKTV